MKLALDILLCAIDAALAMWFLSAFLKKPEGYTKKLDFWLFLLAHFGLNTAALFVTLPPLAVSFTNLGILFLYSLQSKVPCKLARRIVAPVVFEVALALCNLSMIAGSSALLHLDMQLLLTEHTVAFFIIAFATKLLFWTVLSVLLRFFAKTGQFQLEDLFLLIVFPLAMMFELHILFTIAMSDLGDTYRAYIITAALLLLLSNACVYYLIYKSAKNQRVRAEKDLYQQLWRQEEKRYADMDEGLKQMRKLRHDIKNQLLVVSGKLKEQDVEGATAMLDDITGNVVSTAGLILQSGNRIIDYLVNTKLGTLSDTTVLVTGQIEPTLDLRDLDLSILLGNLLDNAIEATRGLEQPKIELRFLRKGQYQSLLVKNSIAQSVLAENATLETTKADATRHGFGVKSVREIVAKYQGQVEFFEEDGLFCAHVLLPVKE